MDAAGIAGGFKAQFTGGVGGQDVAAQVAIVDKDIVSGYPVTIKMASATSLHPALRGSSLISSHSVKKPLPNSVQQKRCLSGIEHRR